MRLSQFRALLVEEFGASYAASLARTHHVHALDSRTVDEALESGVPPRTVWLALCDDMDVPEERRLGRDVRPGRAGPG